MTAAEREAVRLELHRTMRDAPTDVWALRLLDIVEVSPGDSRLDDAAQGLLPPAEAEA